MNITLWYIFKKYINKCKITLFKLRYLIFHMCHRLKAISLSYIFAKGKGQIRLFIHFKQSVSETNFKKCKPNPF